MNRLHIVRINSCGSVGRYVAEDDHEYGRGTAVVCRTQRGLETGEVLANIPRGAAGVDVAGELVRRVGVEDERRSVELMVRRDRAIDYCQQTLLRNGSAAVVVDAIFPLDGQHISFYILGTLDASAAAVARQVGTHFGVNVQFRPATEEDQASCGSGGCGSKGGCGTNSCSTCPAASVCRKS